MYSSSRLVTHGFLSLGLGLGEELGGGKVAEGLVGANGVVGVLPGAEFTSRTAPTAAITAPTPSLRCLLVVIQLPGVCPKLAAIPQGTRDRDWENQRTPASIRSVPLPVISSI